MEWAESWSKIPGEMRVTKDISIEELVEIVPASVGYLRREGIRCIACGEPIWGTLEEAARDRGFGDGDLERIVAEINQLLEQGAATE